MAVLAAGSDIVGRLLFAEQAAALVRSCLAFGLLAAAREPHTPAELAAAADIRPDMAQTLCDALWALEVFDRVDEQYQLNPGLCAMLAPGAPLPLANAFEQSAHYRGLFSQAATPEGTGAPSPELRLAVARGVWGAAASPVALASFATADEQMPEVRAIWQRGGRHLELGCGAGRDLLRVAVPYPNTSVVGVDLEPGVLAEVMRQAHELGIADRVATRACDAREIDDVAAYDTVVWSQMFFPVPVRPAVIAVIRRALKPGGYLILPLLREAPADEPARRSQVGRQVSLSMVLWRSWGLDWPGREPLRAELEAGGFRFLRVVPHLRTAYMLLQNAG